MAKIIRTSTIPASLYILLKGQLNFIGKYFEVVAVSGNGTYLDKVSKRENVRVVPVTMNRKISPLNDIISLFKLVRCFKKEQPIIVHSITPKAGLLSMCAAYLSGVPIRMHTFTGLIFPSKKGILKLLLINMDRLLCFFATNIYPEGEGVKNDLLKYRITSKPLRVLANGNVNGIDVNNFNPDGIDASSIMKLKQLHNITPENFVFIFIGRIVCDKGIVELITAFCKLHSINQNVILLLVGSFEENEDPLPVTILKSIADHKAIIHVPFQEDVKPYYAISDALVFPSYREGFPNVVLEAGAMSLPAIVTDINGSNEIIQNNKNGIIVPSKNEACLYDAMLLISSDKELYTRLKSETRKAIISRFNQKIVWEALLKEYLNLQHDLQPLFKKSY